MYPMPKYTFDVIDAIYIGDETIRIKAKITDKKLEDELNGYVGVRIPSRRKEWKVELKVKEEIIVRKKKHSCPKKYYRVYTRYGNYSYFEHPKGQFHPSDYSLLYCLNCGYTWRTKADYVSQIPDITEEELQRFGSNYDHLKLYTAEE